MLVNANDSLTPEQLDALQILARTMRPHVRPDELSRIMPASSQVQANDLTGDHLISWAQRNFYVPETNSPIVLLPHQKLILRFMFDPKNGFQTLVFSTVKKSGKTTIAGMIARWVAEVFPGKNEIYCMANDYEQARGRIYAKVQESVELTPGYDRIHKTLPNKWRFIEREATYLPKGTTLRAVSSDYKGEAGSNPTATLWSELWGYTSEVSRRLWDELTPVPTRPRSFRFVETYAGFEGESDILIDLYNLATVKGSRLTKADMPEWPFDDDPPIYVNGPAKLCAYWDTGEAARRMPWQTPDYYSAQAATLRPLAFERLHRNLWTSAVGEFLPIEWWDRCASAATPVRPDEPMVLGLDAAVSSDCCAIVGVTRHPDPAKAGTHVALRVARVWYPPQGGSMDYSETIEPAVRELCNRYNIVQVAYDAFQLHKMMTDLRKEGVAWCRPFSQANDRAMADKQLYDLIRDRRLVHEGDTIVREHMRNAAAKQLKDEDSKLRIIKKAADRKIDLVIALSMASYECLRLNL